MSQSIERMRIMFNLASKRNVWTQADVAEFNADIKAAIKRGDGVRLQWWMDQLEALSGLQYQAELCRAAEARIHAAAAAERAIVAA